MVIKNLAFVEGKEQVEAFIKSKENGKYLVVALDIDAENELSLSKIEFKSLRDYDIEINLDTTSFKFCSLWYKKFKNVLNYKDINLGELFRSEGLFSNLLNKINILIYVIDKEKPVNILTVKKSLTGQDFFHDVPLFNILLEITKKNKLNLIIIDTNNKKNKKLNLNLKFYFYIVLMVFQNIFFILKSIFVENKNNLIFVGSLKQFYPLIKRFKGEGYTTIRVGENFGRGFFKRDVSYFLSFKYLYWFKLVFFVSKQKKKFKRIFLKLSKHPDLFDEFLYKGLPLFPMIKDRLEYFFLEEIENYLKYIKITEILIKQHKIKAIILTNDVLPFEKSLVLVAKKYNIPTIVVQFSVPGDVFAFYPFISDRLIIWGEYTKEWLIKNGIGIKKLSIAGSSRFDSYKKEEKINIEDIKNRLNLPLNKKIVLYSPQYMIKELKYTGLYLNPGERSHLDYHLFKAISEFRGVHLVIKLHPSDKDVDFILNSLKKAGCKNYSILTDVDFYKVLVSCDVLITTWSTTGIEGMLVGKPIISVNLKKNKYPLPYIESKATFGVRKPSDFVIALKKTLYDKNYSKKIRRNVYKFMDNNLHKLDGKSTERVMELIQKMLK